MFNTTKTPLQNTKSSLETLVRKFSKENNPVLDLLCHVAEQMEEGLYDPRGSYVEYDNHQCKPFATKTVKLVEKYGLATFHPDSESGVAFLTVHEDMVETLKEFGLFTPESELV